MKIRLQKAIADAGITSRRKAEDLIRFGNVTVNGEIVTELGVRVDPTIDKIKVNNKLIENKREQTVVYAFYKPKSCVTTMSDPQGRRTIVEYFPKTSHRLFPVGRLDYDSEGLILLTNDGDLAHNLAHPSKHVWKKYFVKVKGKVTEQQIKKLRSGPIIEGKKRQPVRMKYLHTVNDNKTWLEVSLQEGLKHHIKKMFKELNYWVLKIKRYSVGNIELQDLAPGESRLLSKSEVKELLQLTQN